MGGRPDTVIATITELVAEVRQGIQPDALTGVGVAAPGPLNPATGIVYATPNLTGWDDFPLAERLSAALDLPVWVNNDANLAALGEAHCGAGRGFDPLIYLTVSTGVGGGIIQAGRIYTGAHGLAGELGHVIIQAGGPRCNFGHAGCLEALASGTGIARRATERLAEGEPSAIPDFVDESGEITSVSVAEAATAGDALALRLYANAGHALGLGIASFLNAYDVARVVIGGGVSQSWSLFEGPMWEAVRAVTMSWSKRPIDIVAAELGDNAGLVGAALYAAFSSSPHTES